MNEPKALLELGGSSLVQRAIGVARGANFRPLVVLGAHADRVAAETGDAQSLFNPNWTDGMGSSIACAVSALPEEARHVAIMAVDQPDVDAALLRDLLDGCLAGADACAARYPDGHLGVPACFSAPLFPELETLGGDRGAKGLLQSGDYDVGGVDAADKIADIDTPDQWQAYRSNRHSG
jgi:molybdenum cofactor cytidylyltransferase